MKRESPSPRALYGLEQLIEALPFAAMLSDAKGHCQQANGACQQLFGLDEQALHGTHWALLLHPEDRAEIVARWQSHSPRDSFVAEARLLKLDGTIIRTRHFIRATQDGRSTADHVHIIESLSDDALPMTVGSLQQADECERAQAALDCVGDAVINTGAAGTITYINAAAAALTGWHRADAVGRGIEEVLRVQATAEDEDPTRRGELAYLQGCGVDSHAYRKLFRRDGEALTIELATAPVHSLAGHAIGASHVFRELRFSRIASSRMAHLATHDALTGLPNRLALWHNLKQALAHARRYKQKLALLFIDLDDFKQINDGHGHAIGDQVLTKLGMRMTHYLRDSDTVFRYGGDEFIVLLSEIESAEDAVQLATRLVHWLAAPQRIGGHDLSVSLSVGIALYPEHGSDTESLLRTADSAMYRAKTNGGACVCPVADGHDALDPHARAPGGQSGQVPALEAAEVPPHHDAAG